MYEGHEYSGRIANDQTTYRDAENQLQLLYTQQINLEISMMLKAADKWKSSEP